MRLNKTIFLLIPIIILVFLLFLLRNKPEDELSHCLKLKNGNGVLELIYPDTFISESYEESGLIRISTRNNERDGKYVLGIDPLNYYAPVNEIINNSLTESGSKYQKIIFNGHEAGY